MGKSKLLWVAIVAVMVGGCSSNSAENGSEEMQEVGTIQEVKEIERKSAWDILDTQYVDFKENDLVNDEDSVLVGFSDGAYINKVVGNENNIYKYYVAGEVELLSTLDSRYSYCEFKNYEDGIVIVGVVEEDSEKLFDILKLEYESNEVENVFSDKSVDKPIVDLDSDSIVVKYKVTEDRVVTINKDSNVISVGEGEDSNDTPKDKIVVKSVNNTDIYFCDVDERIDTEVTVEPNNILYKDGVMTFENCIIRYTTFKDITGSVFSAGYIDTAYPDYVVTTGYEEVAYHSFVERFGEDRKVIGMTTSENQYENMERGINKDEYKEIMDVEVAFLMNENSGGLSGGYNTFHYYIGLKKNGEYILLGTTLLG